MKSIGSLMNSQPNPVWISMLIMNWNIIRFIDLSYNFYIRKFFVSHYLYIFNLKLYFGYLQTLNSEKLSDFTFNFSLSFCISNRASLFSSEFSLILKFNLDQFTYKYTNGSHYLWLRVHSDLINLGCIWSCTT